ncbi:MAG: hypothetical protein LR097_06190 [Dehalococcoidia bacterium]|nr:hypothetical protein [Dehalococcoidia bacterium]
MASVSGLTRFLTTVLADSLGARGTMAVMYVLQGLPVLMLFWINNTWIFYLFAVVFGVGYGGEGSAFSIINRRYYGEGSPDRSFGWKPPVRCWEWPPEVGSAAYCSGSTTTTC